MQCVCAILSSVTCVALPFFPHYLINSTIFVRKLVNIKCVFLFSLQLLSETFLILRRTEWDMIKNIYIYIYIGLHVKYRCYSCQTLMKVECCQIFKKILKYQISWKIHPVGSELFQADGWTRRNWVTFRNFANAPKTCCTSGPRLATVIILFSFEASEIQIPIRCHRFKADEHHGHPSWSPVSFSSMNC